MAQPGEIVVGQLFKGGLVNGLPYWKQPGGVGTKVYPQLPTQFPEQNMGYPQTPFSYPAMYYFNCNHPLNCPEIFQYYDKYLGKQMVAICCPMCSYVQQILTLSDYQNYLITPIVTA